MKIEAKQRLQSFETNRWTKNAGGVLSHDFISEDNKPFLVKNNLEIYRLSPYKYVVTFEDELDVIAQMLMNERNQKRVDVVSVRPAYLGQGIGKFMYEAVLSKLGRLESSDYLSIGSTATWAFLCSKHHGVLVVNRQEVAIHGFYKEAGFTFPILKRADGSKVFFAEVLNSANPKEKKAASASFYRIRK